MWGILGGEESRATVSRVGANPAPTISAAGRAITSGRPAFERWQTILFWLVIVALFAIAVGMRLYDLGLPFDRDTYDEGVYWQSLRAMSAGHPLYQEVFYSQPPFFLLSTFPGYVLFGGTLWSARFGIALVSLFGLLGAFLLGKALAGRLGAIAALLLIVVNPLYLAQSQTIQAEVSCVAFSLLAVGLAYLWWEHPEGVWGIILAGLAGMALSLSILCKLFGIAALAPLALLMLARLWQIWRQPGTRFASILPLVVGIGTCILTILLVMLPFVGSFQALVQSVIFFHTDAGTVAGTGQQGNSSVIEHALYSILTLAALYGTPVALLGRDWRVLPLLAWLFVTIFLLWRQVPLFTHHLVVLTPPLIALAVIGILPISKPDPQGRREGSLAWCIRGILPISKPDPQGRREASLAWCIRGIGRIPAAFKTFLPALAKYTTWLTILAILLILVTAVLNVREDRQYYRMAEAKSHNGLPQQEAGQEVMRAAADLHQAIAPDQLVVTDAQFVVALADRSTPPSLVDTSQVRISSGHLTLSELISMTSEPQVHAVLFFTGRFQSSEVAAFHAWVAHHFYLLHNYGDGRELWVR